MVFLDLETTGATATRDRITEVGLVEISDQSVERYSQLVNPEARIPEFIQGLTGITDEMVSDAPVFAEIAHDLAERLQGKLFVAHNARFDYGFLKNEFKRLGIDFRARVLCTVKLSRELYPQESRHNLDALIARHGLQASGRHRALADADLIAG
jgi:DNA polymerase-3 subunit epsilon